MYLLKDFVSSHYVHRLNSVDVKYQIWKLGVVFTDNVSNQNQSGERCLAPSCGFPAEVLKLFCLCCLYQSNFIGTFLVYLNFFFLVPV